MSHDELKKDFQKCVERAAGHRHVVDVFGDMVRAMAIAIESPFTIGERNEELEREYAAIKARYTAAEFQEFPKALAITGAAIELKREDFLGHALEALGASNTRNGQFLTPVCVSRMMAALLYPKLDDYTPGKIIKLNDPSCGTSVLLIEGAERLISQGVQQADLLVIAGDIDLRACDASYVQLAFLGYPAIVQHMDALAMKRISPDRFTPGYFLHRFPMRQIEKPVNPSIR
jgi:type I restriction-modification system DNA methylase subunit